MKALCLSVLLLFVLQVFAHEPAISSTMIYDQNSKRILVIKTSLTAFEGEVEYYYGKNAFKTADEFRLLVIKHFEKNCFVIMNNDTVKLIKPTVVLGHEITVFAELANSPEKPTSCYVKNTCFKDLHNNMCELFLSLKGLPQKQYILNAENKNEVTLKLVNNQWVVENPTKFSYSAYLWLGGLAIVIILAVVVTIKNKLKDRNTN